MDEYNVGPRLLFTDAFGARQDRLQRAAAWSVILLAVITVTGAAVRLTGSGLGCDDWPNCTDQQFIAPWEFHAWVEFGNRLVTGLVAIPVITTAILAVRRRRDRPVVMRWAIAVGLATLANAIVGAVTVKLELTPPIVIVHFLLSIGTIWLALVTHDRASRPHAAPTGRVVAWTVPLSALVVLASGTVVTGTGPHGGDPEAERLDLLLRTTAQVHSISMWIFVASILWWAVRSARSPHADPLLSPIRLLVSAMAAQGSIGYLQYWLGVPPGLVAAHVAGAVVVWCAAAWLGLSAARRTPLPADRDVHVGRPARPDPARSSTMDR